MSAKAVRANFQPEAFQKGLSFIDDLAEIQRQLKLAATHYSEVLIQVRGREEKFRGHFIELLSGGFAIEFGHEVNRDEAWTVLQTGRECLVLVFAKNQFLKGIHAQWTKGFGDRVEFDFPKRLFRLQRRGGVRYMLSAAYEITAFVQREGYAGFERHRMQDISRGGCSLSIKRDSDFRNFQKGLALTKLVFTLQGKKYEAQATVRSCTLQTGNPSGGYRVGLEFTHLSQEQRQEIDEFVLLKSAYALSEKT